MNHRERKPSLVRLMHGTHFENPPPAGSRFPLGDVKLGSVRSAVSTFNREAGAAFKVIREPDGVWLEYRRKGHASLVERRLRAIPVGGSAPVREIGPLREVRRVCRELNVTRCGGAAYRVVPGRPKPGARPADYPQYVVDRSAARAPGTRSSAMPPS